MALPLDERMSSSLVEQWAVKSSSWAESWFSESFIRDTDALTWALRKSLSSPSPAQAQPIMVLSNTAAVPIAETPGSSSDSPEPGSPATPKPPLPARASVPPATGRVSKRKSRATKRLPTTYINADPANFRQMVQEVTGVRTSGVHLAASAEVLKPEPQRLGGGRLLQHQGGCLLPTLDTSAFLLGYHQQQAVGPVSYGSGEGGLSSELEVAFPSFPTLESWRVM